jgi:hypothetical protein|tara:strand:+ start:881 stop:1471 length:591 start_codon:yes stop_codon:yes gene_type:complete
MATQITTSLQIQANVRGASKNPGPMSTPIGSTVSQVLLVDKALTYTIPSVRQDTTATGFADESPYGQVLIDGSKFTASAHTTSSGSGTVDHHGCWVYVKNTSPSTSRHLIAIGHTTDTDAATDDDNADGDNNTATGAELTPLVDGDNNTHANANQRLFSLRAGEFAFFPYDYTGDLYAQSTGANQSLEFWKFDRTE